MKELVEAILAAVVDFEKERTVAEYRKVWKSVLEFEEMLDICDPEVLDD